MAKRPRLNKDQYEIIADHLEPLIDAAATQIYRLRALKRELKTSHIVRQIQYWKDCKSALEWSLALARQRIRDKNNGNRQPIRPIGENS